MQKEENIEGEGGRGVPFSFPTPAGFHISACQGQGLL